MSDPFTPPGIGGFGMLDYSTDKAPVYVVGVSGYAGRPETWLVCGRVLDNEYACALSRPDAVATAEAITREG